jgi:hypothetical protein
MEELEKNILYAQKLMVEKNTNCVVLNMNMRYKNKETIIQYIENGFLPLTPWDENTFSK